LDQLGPLRNAFGVVQQHLANPVLLRDLAVFNRIRGNAEYAQQELVYLLLHFCGLGLRVLLENQEVVQVEEGVEGVVLRVPEQLGKLLKIARHSPLPEGVNKPDNLTLGSSPSAP